VTAAAGCAMPASKPAHIAQPFFDQILEIAAAQRRLRLGPAVKIIRHFDVVFMARFQSHNPMKNFYATIAIQAHYFRAGLAPFDSAPR
jgi:hypothetical protein